MTLPFSLLVKPVGAACNLACDYCFYLDKAALYPDGPRVMPDAVLERMLRSYLALPFDSYCVTFQGGEPLLAELDFYRRVAEIVKRYGQTGKKVNLSLQTNATLMTREAAEFFASEGWLVGVSVDGPADIHNAHRVTPIGGGSHADVVRGIGCLREAGCAYNLLTLVTGTNVNEPERIYRYLRDELGGCWQQYTDHLESVSIAEWDQFLCRIFDVWLTDGDADHVSVRNIDAALAYARLGRTDQCIFSDQCDNYFVIERNGDVYPCDFFVSAGTRLGNVMTDDWSALRRHPDYRRFASTKCPRHLSRISRMRFYDRLSRWAIEPNRP